MFRRDEYDEPRRGWVKIAVAVVIGVLLAGVAIAGWTVGRDNGNASNTTASGGSQSTDDAREPSSSICDLPDGDQTVPEVPFEVESWNTDWSLPFPEDSELGPCEESSTGVRSGYARNPQGAVSAAAAGVAAMNTRAVMLEYVETRATRAGEYLGAVREARAGSGQLAGEGDLEADLIGARLLRYDSDRAVASLLYETPDGALVVFSVDLRWQDGDWYQQFTYFDDDEVPTGQVPTTEGFFAWGPSFADEPDTEGSSSSDQGAGEVVGATSAAFGPGAGAAPVVRTGAAITVESSALAAPAVATNPAALQAEGDNCGGLIAGFNCGLGSVAGDLIGAGGDAVELGEDVVDVVRDPGGAVADAGNALLGGAFGQLAQAAADGAEWAFTTLMTAWMQYPDPSFGSGGVVAWANAHLAPIVALVLIGATFVTAYRLAVTQRWEHGREYAYAVVRVVLITGGLGFVLTVALEAGDEFTNWIMSEARVEMDLMQFENVLIVFMLGLLVIIIQLAQLAIMIARSAVVPLLAAALPIAAAASVGSTGQQAYYRIISWLLAFVLIKPVTALIYAIAIVGTSSDDPIEKIGGIMLMLFSLIALPGLLRLVAPVSASMGGANAGAMAGAVVGGALATGAVLATGGAAAGGLAAAGSGAGGAGAMGSVGRLAGGSAASRAGGSLGGFGSGSGGGSGAGGGSGPSGSGGPAGGPGSSAGSGGSGGADKALETPGGGDAPTGGASGAQGGQGGSESGGGAAGGAPGGPATGAGAAGTTTGGSGPAGASPTSTSTAGTAPGARPQARPGSAGSGSGSSSAGSSGPGGVSSGGGGQALPGTASGSRPAWQAGSAGASGGRRAADGAGSMIEGDES
ncbi:hypothetical protein [Nocardioides alkalitolerans]|uniref:hypothetical protein n=1 Tax=Nocardioides alkalitolerans TaxID=281714 RepID=UPI0004235C4C|nr:hypothetical protein [Nocardioides alkalitolerans]